MLLVSVLRQTRRECSVGQGHLWLVTSVRRQAGKRGVGCEQIPAGGVTLISRGFRMIE